MSDAALTLTDISPDDKPWSMHKKNNVSVGEIYSRSRTEAKKAGRMADCGGILDFDEIVDGDTGEVRLRLSKARFCRVRLCSVCQWRRSLYWKARFYQALPGIIADNPKSRFIFLTLTIRNCEVTNLRNTLDLMTKAWGKLTRRKAFGIVQGWVRTTEITRGENGTAHPHFHVLLMVPGGYFAGHSYMKQAEWTELWRSCLKIDYEPIVDVRTVKNRKRKGEDDSPLPVSGLKEVLKYSVKTGDMIADEAWFLEMSKQIAGTRAIALGGYFADILKDAETSSGDMPTEENLIHLGADEEATVEAANIMQFLWRNEQHQYLFWRRSAKAVAQPELTKEEKTFMDRKAMFDRLLKRDG